MSWSKGSDVQRELARKHARQLMTAFDEVMKRGLRSLLRSGRRWRTC